MYQFKGILIVRQYVFEKKGIFYQPSKLLGLTRFNIDILSMTGQLGDIELCYEIYKAFMFKKT